MKVKSLMSRDVVTLSPLMEVAAAARFLTERGITGAPVVDSKGNLLGVVSQTDLTRFQGRVDIDGWDESESKTDWHPKRETTPLISVMTQNPLSCDEETSVDDAAQLMLERRIHRLLVTSKGKLAGIVTSMDLLRAVETSK